MSSSKTKTYIRVIAIVLAVLMAAGVLVNVVASLSASATSIADLQQKKNELANQKKAVQAKIESAEYEKASVVEKKNLLDQQIILTQQEIDEAVKLIDEYTAFIAQAELDIIDLQAQEEEQWQAYKKRVRVMEESGNISYLEVLFTATSFSELLSRVDSVSEIMEKDRNIYNDLVDTRNELTKLKEEKEQAKIDQENEKAELESKERDLENQVAQAENLIAQYQEAINSNKDLISEIEAEDAKIDQQIKDAENTPSDVVGEGEFIWPARGGRVTSPFGNRNSPTAGASSYHKGIDIGGLGYGADILASKSGTVTTATYSSSYGYYVIINHGDGTTTTYAHASRLLVSRGQTVTQGQVIAKVGSTGISTGPHIHFEITVNGSRVDPQKYV